MVIGYDYEVLLVRWMIVGNVYSQQRLYSFYIYMLAVGTGLEAAGIPQPGGLPAEHVSEPSSATHMDAVFHHQGNLCFFSNDYGAVGWDVLYVKIRVHWHPQL